MGQAGSFLTWLPFIVMICCFFCLYSKVTISWDYLGRSWAASEYRQRGSVQVKKSKCKPLLSWHPCGGHCLLCWACCRIVPYAKHNGGKGRTGTCCPVLSRCCLASRWVLSGNLSETLHFWHGCLCTNFEPTLVYCWVTARYGSMWGCMLNVAVTFNYRIWRAGNLCIHMLLLAFSSAEDWQMIQRLPGRSIARYGSQRRSPFTN